MRLSSRRHPRRREGVQFAINDKRVCVPLLLYAREHAHVSREKTFALSCMRARMCDSVTIRYITLGTFFLYEDSDSYNAQLHRIYIYISRSYFDIYLEE